MVDGFSWALAALGAAVERRQEISAAYQGLWRALGLSRARVAISGLSGAGKSTLIDDFEGATGERGYRPPSASLDTDEGNIGTRKTGKVRLLAIPGTNAAARAASTAEVFGGGRLAGVVHVVSAGYARMREPAAIQQAISGGLDTLEKFRKSTMEEEIADLQQVAQHIRQHRMRHGSRMFLSVLVNKYDLYHHSEPGPDAVREHYHRLGRSGFSEALRTLTRQVGEDNILVETSPIAAWSEDFVWNKEVQPSRLERTARDALTVRYLGQLTEMVRSAEKQ